ncbi:MAG: tyrosine-type recombinase/integrase [Lentimicrobium sp.]|jgi:site-specific recombinase XerD|nr:tyrosine-type recombinase/integrase [Lentimicrobium sp.]
MNSNLTIQQLISTFLAQKDIAATSRKTYRSTLGSFFRWMVDKKYTARKPKREQIIEYKAYLIQVKKSDATSNLYLNSLKSFFSWLEESKIYPNVAGKIKAPKRYQGFKKQRLSIDQLNYLLNSIERNTLKEQRDYSMILLAFTNGLRTVELSRLLIENIDTVLMKAHIQRKGDLYPMQWLPITKECLNSISQYIQSRIDAGEEITNNSHLFVSNVIGRNSNPLSAQEVGAIISKRLKAAGLHSKTVTAHSLRHSAASYLLESGWSVYEVQKFLGHKSVTTTELYLKTADLVNMHNEKPQETLSKMLQKIEA